MSDDLKATVFLPKTDFPMRGGLPTMEPKIQALWADMDFFTQLRKHRQGAEKFILHDGPPYANGHLHIGHALNKILKDMVNRFQSGLGKDANYIPGWDCHGLPIEWKIEETYRKKGKDKDDVPIVEFRQECRDFAAHWVGVQSEEFQRLGVMGNWATPYLTMSYHAEAVIAAEIGKFLMNGALYRGSKPVMWSAVEKTALAEAEIEYFDRRSTTIYARFPVRQTPHDALKGASVIIWTTTPWTMPGNRATAYGGDIAYGLYEVAECAENSLAIKGEKLLLADDLAEAVAEACGITKCNRLADIAPALFKDTILAHPLADAGYPHHVPMLEADYVTTEQGTGLVHIAPGHGAEDYVLGLAHGIEVPDTIGADGRVLDHLPLFGGMSALKDNEKIADILAEKGGLIGRGDVTHSYPHSWRSHAPLIFRNTPQWFISMEETGLRATALEALGKTAFYPPSGQVRLTSMIETRPDWCISRQRAWGIPLPIFVHKKTGAPLRDEKVMARIVEAFESEGADAWFASPPARFLGTDRVADDYEQVTDIVDVWFDSGSTHAFLLEENNEMSWPADMYLEGSDQHRGWFHSSLLEACGTRGTAPYKAVLTHGFVLDEAGRKMSKSLGNTITPQQVIEQNGADILRLWVASSDYYDDLRIGKEIIQRQVDHYRRLRNTLRYLLGSLQGFEDSEKLDYADMPPLEKWVLMRLSELDEAISTAAAQHDYHQIFTMLHHFCNSDLSAFYFDIRKDVLYCGAVDALERRACRTVMDLLFDSLAIWFAPILCFTAEEAWQTRYPNPKDSVHFRTFPKFDKAWQDLESSAKWKIIRLAREAVNGALEQARENGMIKSSLQACPTLYAPQQVVDAFKGLDAAELFITSGANLVVGTPPSEAHYADEAGAIGVVVELAQGARCDRCWKMQADRKHATHALCQRCYDVISS